MEFAKATRACSKLQGERLQSRRGSLGPPSGFLRPARDRGERAGALAICLHQPPPTGVPCCLEGHKTPSLPNRAFSGRWSSKFWVRTPHPGSSSKYISLSSTCGPSNLAGLRWNPRVCILRCIPHPRTPPPSPGVCRGAHGGRPHSERLRGGWPGRGGLHPPALGLTQRWDSRPPVLLIRAGLGPEVGWFSERGLRHLLLTKPWGRRRGENG